MRVFVGIINNWPYLHTYFVRSVMDMMVYAARMQEETDIVVDFEFVWGAYVDSMRNEACKRALKGNYDFLIQLDADMVYPRDTIHRLVKHDLPVVNGVYYWKILKPALENPSVKGFAAHAYKKRKKDMFDEKTGMERYDSIAVGRVEEDLVKVDGLGGGGLCVKREVLEKIGSPWFECRWEDASSISGEDLLFCRKAQEAGYDIYCDITLSFGHLTQGVVADGKLYETNSWMGDFIKKNVPALYSSGTGNMLNKMLSDIEQGNVHSLKKMEAKVKEE